jgi:multidrug efflux pump
MSSTSLSGVSTISVYLRLNYDGDKALTEINTKIASVLNQLPTGTQQPQLTVQVGLLPRRRCSRPLHQRPEAR